MKRPLPNIRWTHRSFGSRELALRWLEQWNLRQELIRQAEEDEEQQPETQPGGDMRDLSHLVAPYDPHPAVGDIRLLSPQWTSRLERPVYVAILKEWDEGLVAAVFSSFLFPALSTELIFPKRAPALRVLCLWNHYVAPVSVLAQSWLVDKLTEDELRDARQVFRHAMTDEPLPAALAERVGTKISSATDPRLAYRQQELDLLAPFAEAIQHEIEQEATQPEEVGERIEGWKEEVPSRIRVAVETLALAAAGGVCHTPILEWAGPLDELAEKVREGSLRPTKLARINDNPVVRSSGHASGQWELNQPLTENLTGDFFLVRIADGMILGRGQLLSGRFLELREADSGCLEKTSAEDMLLVLGLANVAP